METRIYKLILRGAFHLGLQGFAREHSGNTIPSDTLFSALATVWVQQSSQANDWLNAFTGTSAPLLLTSTFPFAGMVRFYPHPFLRHGTPMADEARSLRRYRWVSHDLFERMLAGSPIKVAGETGFVQEKEVWLSRSEIARLPSETLQIEGTNRLWKHQTQPRVTLDRRQNASQIYHIGRVQYAPGCGLWFAARAADPVWFKRLEAGLDALSDSGLGGLRSIGHGAFSWEIWKDAALPGVNGAAEYAVTLSRFAPAGEAEIAQTLGNSRALYQLELIPGWSPGEHGLRRRKQVRMVAEGAVLPMPFSGRLVDVTPDIGIADVGHPIYRYGFAFPLKAAPQAIPDVGEEIYG